MNTEDIISEIDEKAKTLLDVGTIMYNAIMCEPEEKRREAFEKILSEVSVLNLDVSKWNDFSNELYDILDAEKEPVRVATRLTASLLKNRVDKKTFYDELWDKVNDSFLWQDDERSIFLLALWLDSRIPYYEIGEGIQMSEDEYTRRKINLSDVLDRATFISSLQFNQKTQKASLLAEEAEKLSDKRDKAVYWAIMMGMIESQTESRIYRKMMEEQQARDTQKNIG